MGNISPPSQKVGHAGSCQVESVHDPRKYSQPATGSSTTHSLLLVHCDPALQHIDAPLGPHATAPPSTLPSGQKHCCPAASVASSRRSVSTSGRRQTNRRMSTSRATESEQTEEKPEIQPSPAAGRAPLMTLPRLAVAAAQDPNAS
jgi:hypothetical protein